MTIGIVRRSILILVSVTLGTMFEPCVSLADEGIWTFDNPPVMQLKERYGFELTQQWLDHLRLSSLRFNEGLSGSFVSPHGLVLTSHYIAIRQLEKISTPGKDYVTSGFLARTEAEELKCLGLELRVQISKEEDVTGRVRDAVKSGMSDEAALSARKAEIARIEKESLARTGLQSEVISLYQGAEYWLYRYKTYTDVRLVFAPEQQIAFFGGEPDGFTYPRYALDFALFRVYENGKHVECKHYLKWNVKGARPDELVFVSGHPASVPTWPRLETMAQIETEKDHELPLVLETLTRGVEIAQKYAAAGPEEARQAARTIYGLNHLIKLYSMRAKSYTDPDLLAKVENAETSFRALVASNPAWKKAYGGAWDEIAQNEMKRRQMMKLYRFYLGNLDHGSLWAYQLIDMALDLVRYVEEVPKPDRERFIGYHEPDLDYLRFRLLGPEPSYDQLEKTMAEREPQQMVQLPPGPFYLQFERAMLEGTLELALERLGPNDPFIKAVLGTRTPAEVARQAISHTKLTDRAFRNSLVEGGLAALQASDDSMIQLARTIEPFERQRVRTYDEIAEIVEAPARKKIGEAQYAVYGKALYPDATMTLRLSFGVVKGYPMNGTQAPPSTTFFGLYDRSFSFGNKPPYNLPARYLKPRSTLELATPLDFVGTWDIIGSDSGSPVVNSRGEVVGMIFDQNSESTVGNFVYYDLTHRGVAIHSGAIIEVLRNLYDDTPLADELEGK